MNVKNKKCAYTDEQLSIIMSAKAGGQLIAGGVDSSYRPGEAVGCLNQVAFPDRNLSVASAVEEDHVGLAAVRAATRFDDNFDIGKLSYERLLRICNA